MNTNTPALLDFYSLESPFATEFRRLLQRLRALDRDRELKSVLVTSATLSEGKSTVCALLALTAAKKGQKVLLVDSDIRRPTLHRLVDANREPGVTEILLQGAIPKELLQKTRLEALDFIGAGEPVHEAAEVFDAPTIGRFISEFKFYYDLIIVDCAPVIPVSDPMLLAPEVDGTLIVVRAGQTSKELAGRAVDILRSGASRLCGVVVNNANDRLPGYYDYSYYGYNYKATGAERPRNRPGVNRPKSVKKSETDSGSSTVATEKQSSVRKDNG